MSEFGLKPFSNISEGLTNVEDRSELLQVLDVYLVR